MTKLVLKCTRQVQTRDLFVGITSNFAKQISNVDIIDFYKKNPDAIRNITAPIYEDKVVDFVLEKVTLKDKKVSRKDLFGAESPEEKPKEAKNKAKKRKTVKKKA